MSVSKYNQLKQKFNGDITSCIIHRNNLEEFYFFKNNVSQKQLHRINSITKSVLSLLMGIAWDKGYLKNLNKPISTFFPELHNAQDGKKKITIFHLLTMTSGLNCPGLEQMKQLDDWIDFILSRPMRNQPGEVMHYCNGNSHLLSVILQRATGEDTASFAEKHLFSPLDIKQYEWARDPKGNPIGGFGLYLQSADLIKIGKLCLMNGQWEGEKVVSQGWIQEAVKSHVKTKIGNQTYGYHWWVSSSNTLNQYDFFYAAGKGGQYIFVEPKEKLVAIFTGEFNGRDSVKPYQWFVNDIVLPNSN